GREAGVDDDGLVRAVTADQPAVRLVGVVREDVEVHRAAMLSGDPNAEPPAGGQIVAASSQSVTGPSFTSSTAMCSRKAPRRTVAPRASSAIANASTRSAAISGAEAASQDGRRPFRTSP